jgi:hypothetical protein
MEKLFDNVASIITAASTSGLGLAALLICAAAVMGVVLFRRAPVWARLVVWFTFTLAAGASAYIGQRVIRESRTVEVANSTPPAPSTPTPETSDAGSAPRPVAITPRFAPGSRRSIPRPGPATRPRPLPSPAPDTIAGTIVRPDVSVPSSSYPHVLLFPGDTLVLEAGGCAQTGGAGKTWKRYPEPMEGGNLYIGVASIPSVTKVLEPLRDFVGRPLAIGAAAPPEGAPLVLGYRDDNYGDNGYWGRDPGTNDQCLNQPDAWVKYTIVRPRSGQAT